MSSSSTRKVYPWSLLAGTQLDLRSDPETLARLEAKGIAPVSFEQGAALAQKRGAVAYCESALTASALR